ncbi:hypothetical protein V1509DRAFT_392407 [Lipomyces kononenkoae]
MMAGRIQRPALFATVLTSSTAHPGSNCLRWPVSSASRADDGRPGLVSAIGERRTFQKESSRRREYSTIPSRTGVRYVNAHRANRELAGLVHWTRVIGLSRLCRCGVKVHGFHSSTNSSAWYDFMLGKNQTKKDVKLNAEEVEELSAVTEKSKEGESQKAAGEEDIGDEYRPVTLDDFDYRVSKIKPVIPQHVQNLDASGLVDGEIYEIGFKKATRSWKTQMNGFKIDMWKANTPVHDKKQVLKIAKLVAADQLGVIKIDWPTGSAIELDRSETESGADPFAEVVESHHPPSLDFDISTFSLRDINVRFQVVKRMSQLTGRPIPDLVFTRALTMKEILVYYAVDTHRRQSYGLFQDDPYNPYVTRLYIDPHKFEGTNVKIN